MKDREVSDFAGLVSTLARQAQAETDFEHPADQRLLDYYADALDPKTEEQTRDHLVSCPRCAARLLDMAPLAEPEEPSVEGVVDFELAASWRELQNRIGGQSARPSLPTSRRWRAAAAAIFVILPLGLAVDGLHLRSSVDDLTLRLAELQRPRANPALFIIGPPMRSDVKSLELKSSAPFFILDFSRGDHPFSEYQLRLVSFDDQLLGSLDLFVDDKGSARALLYRDALPATGLWVELYGLGDGEPQFVRKVHLHFLPEDPPDR